MKSCKGKSERFSFSDIFPDIDRDELARRTKVFAESALKTTGVVASWAAEKAVEGAGAAVQGAKDLYQRGLDDYAKRQEIERIQKFCAETEDELRKHRDEYIRDYEKEREAYNALIPTVNELLRTHEKLERLVAREFKLFHAGEAEEGPVSIDIEEVSSDVFRPVLTGGLAGVSAGAGAVGLMTALGTAGTGTALSSLTGMAYIKATLAALGGGPLYAGGAGMMGGAIVLGLSVLTPAAVVAGYLFDKDINEKYPKALEKEQEELRAKEEAELIFRQLQKGTRQTRQLAMELYSFSGFFRELLNMSRAAVKIEHQDLFFDVLRYAAGILCSFTAILERDSKPNPDFDKDFAELQQEEKTCKAQLDAYRRAVDPERQELLDESSEKDLIIEELERDLEKAREQLEENRHFTEDLRQKLEKVTDDKRRLEMVEAEFLALQKKMAERQPEKLEQILAKLGKQFHAFERETLRMLGTGELLFQQYKDNPEIDCCGIVIEYGKSTERITTTILEREGFDLNTIKKPTEKEASFHEKIKAFCRKLDRKAPQWVWDNFYSLRQTRNNAAHLKAVRLEETKKLRSILFGGNGSANEGLLAHLHQRLC